MKVLKTSMAKPRRNEFFVCQPEGEWPASRTHGRTPQADLRLHRL
jgi:hypothetical protein